jgi:hypothetical protein
MRSDVTELSQRALEVSRQAGDPWLEAWGLALVSGVAYRAREDDLARRRGEEALAIARSSADDQLIGQMLMNVANYARDSSVVESRKLHAESIQYFRLAGDSLFTAVELHNLAGVCLSEDRPVEARGHLEEAITLASEVGAELFVFLMRSDLCSILLADGAIDEAAVLVRSCLVTARRLALYPQLCGLLFAAACCATWQDDTVRAARLHGAADAAIASAVEMRNFGWTASEDRVREEARAHLSETMPTELREREYLQGAGLSIVQAVDLALSRVPAD